MVEALGTNPINYQWFKDNVAIADATSNVLAFDSIRPADAGRYHVRIQNKAGEVTSNEVELTVTPVADLNSVLVARWPFDTTENGTTPDVVQGLDLTLNNMDESNLVEGRFGSAFSFDGVDEILTRIHTNSAGGLPISQHRVSTISFWVKAFGAGQVDRRAFSEASTTNAQPLFNIGTHNTGADGTVDLLIREDNGVTSLNHAHSIVEAYDDTWRHVVIVNHGSRFSIYIDGTLDETAPGYTRGILTANTTSIGGILRAAASHFFTGVIDDVAVWGRALSQEEITQVFNNEWPNLPEPAMNIQSIARNGNRLEILVETSNPEAVHTLQQTSSLNAPSWSNVGNVTWTAAGNNLVRAEIDAPADTQFFRVSR
ncbi:MAG: LamG-like jellyroll fold domain-containing protein [Verrucomicrobiales bacterium]